VTPAPTLSCAVAGDINCDSHVNSGDLAVLLGHWGSKIGATRATGDLNVDRAVNQCRLGTATGQLGAVGAIALLGGYNCSIAINVVAGHHPS
jgi:hypothetical protein